MSGGSYDYAYLKLDDELGRWPSILEAMADDCRKWASSVRAATKWVTEPGASRAEHVPTTLEDRAAILVRAMLLDAAAKRLREAIAKVRELEDVMHDVEWVASGDYGVDALMGQLK